MKIVFKTCGFNLTNLHLRFFLLTCQQLFQFRIHQGKSQYSLNNVPKTCGRKTDSVHNEEQIQRHVLMENQAVIPNSEAAYRQPYLKSTAPDIPRGHILKFCPSEIPVRATILRCNILFRRQSPVFLSFFPSYLCSTLPCAMGGTKRVRMGLISTKLNLSPRILNFWKGIL